MHNSNIPDNRVCSSYVVVHSGMMSAGTQIIASSWLKHTSLKESVS